MTGITIQDTFGPLMGFDQLCEAHILGDVRVGDMMTVETESELIELCVSSLDLYQPEGSDEVGNLFGVGLCGDGADLLLPGDVLEHSRPRQPKDMALVIADNSVHEREFASLGR